ncbi:MAG: hypothetical protein Q8N44_16835, partial [Rubrivivax sp.]|nr:hypothetical protein [Rubrivivax sp.]
MKCLLVASLGLAVLSAVQAQTVWRCGADGSRYADSPCDGGQVVAVADSRSPEQVRAAQALAAREQRVAAQWVSEREQRERVALAR